MQDLAFSLAPGKVMQVAYVVEDIERELAFLTAKLQIGPFFYLPHFPLFDVKYHDQPTSIDVAVALAFRGDTCVELIHQNCSSPSPLREHVAKRGYGFHHWGVATRSFEADAEERQRQGMRLVATATVGLGGRIAYLETPSELGAFIELIELTPPGEQFFGMVHAAAIGWDGSAPVRRLDPPA